MLRQSLLAIRREIQALEAKQRLLAGMLSLHWERALPERHHVFLLSLGIDEEEVRAIRARSASP